MPKQLGLFGAATVRLGIMERALDACPRIAGPACGAVRRGETTCPGAVECERLGELAAARIRAGEEARARGKAAEAGKDEEADSAKVDERASKHADLVHAEAQSEQAVAGTVDEAAHRTSRWTRRPVGRWPVGNTAIPYAKKALNALVGCPPPACSKGCARCWARDLHDKRHRARLAGKALPDQYLRPFSEVQFFPERLKEPLSWRRAQRVFVAPQADLFHSAVSDKVVAAHFGLMAATPRHLYLTLTKRPERMLEWCTDLYRPGAINDAVIELDLLGFGWGISTDLLRWPLPNVLLGASVCSQDEADRIIPTMVRLAAKGWRTWLSVEPMLGRVDLGLMGTCPKDWGVGYRRVGDGLEWVVIGGESAPWEWARPCDLSWIRALKEQCENAGARVFVKQMGTHAIGGLSDPVGIEFTGAGANPLEWPRDLRVRELPEVHHG